MRRNAHGPRRFPIPVGDSGYTLIELAVTIGLLSIVSVIFTSTLVSVQRAVGSQSERTDANDQARLAIQDFDRQVRSGNLLLDPADEVTNTANSIYPGMSVRVYTQANASTQPEHCVQWRIKGDLLQTRSWTETWTIDHRVSTWRTVADHVVNMSRAGPVSAFVLVSPLVTAGGSVPQTLQIRLVINATDEPSGEVKLNASITGRNVQYRRVDTGPTSPEPPCSPSTAPPYPVET